MARNKVYAIGLGIAMAGILYLLWNISFTQKTEAPPLPSPTVITSPDQVPIIPCDWHKEKCD